MILQIKTIIKRKLAFVIPTDNGFFSWFDEPTELPTITFILRHMSHSIGKFLLFLRLLFSFLFSFGKKRRKQKQNNIEEKERNFERRTLMATVMKRKDGNLFVLFYCVFLLSFVCSAGHFL